MPTRHKPLLKLEVMRQARRMAHWAQQDLADAAGTTAATISDMESGRNHEPSHLKAMRIFMALVQTGTVDHTLDGLLKLFPVSRVQVPARLFSRKRKRRA